MTGFKMRRRTLLGGLAALPLLGGEALRAQPARQPIAASIALEDGRVWVAATIAGKPPMLFIVDTGAVVSLIQPSVSRTLDLRSRGATRLVGVGGPQTFELFEARDIVFGGAIRQRSAVFAAPRQDIPLHPDAAGLLAAGMLTSVDSDLDFDAGEWRVYPKGREARDGFALLSSRISGSSGGSEYIYVDAAIDGRSYRLLVDTGMPGQILLFGAAARSSGLWNDRRPFVPVQARGIGGLADRGRLVRAGQVTIGPIAFERPLVELSAEAHPASFGEGIIGLSLLELLTLSTDVRGNRLWAKRNRRAPRPERYGMSGLWLEEKNGKVLVAVVSPGSPAAASGLAVGDEVLGGPLRALIPELSGPPGSEVALDTRRGSQARTVKLVLRPYI
jgi:serine protease Do